MGQINRHVSCWTAAPLTVVPTTASKQASQAQEVLLLLHQPWRGEESHDMTVRKQMVGHNYQRRESEIQVKFDHEPPLMLTAKV